ncbi:putative GTP-binding protein, partial [Aphelenchoides avenae]
MYTEFSTTCSLVSRSSVVPDERFDWLAKAFGTGKRRPARITFTDIPALLSTTTEDAYIAPWEDDVYQALTGSDIVFLVVRASSDPPTEQPEYYAGDYASDDHYDTSSQRAEFHGVVNDLFREHDLRTLTKLLKNEPFRHVHQVLENINETVRGYTRYGEVTITTDTRTRYHDWEPEQVAVLERIRLLTSKPIVYIVAGDTAEFTNVNKLRLRPLQESIKQSDSDALIVPFTDGVVQHATGTHLVDVAQLSGARAIVPKALEFYRIGRVYTANNDLVAAWTVKDGTTLRDAIDFANATLGPNVTVEALSMREVIEAGSIEDATRLGKVRRLGFENSTKDGDLLLLDPGDLRGIAEEVPISMTVLSTRALMDEGAWMHFNVVLLALIIGLLATWRNGSLIKRLRESFDAYRRRRRQGLLD